MYVCFQSLILKIQRGTFAEAKYNIACKAVLAAITAELPAEAAGATWRPLRAE